jgi:hypothetical protein
VLCVTQRKARPYEQDLPEDQRWVALLNTPDRIAAYNAGMSGANTVDKYYSFEYLSEQGWNYNLVVISSMINDLRWIMYLDRYGHALRVEGYSETLEELPRVI